MQTIVFPFQLVLQKDLVSMAAYKAVIFDVGGVIMSYCKMPYIFSFFEITKKDPALMKLWAEMEEGRLTMLEGNHIFSKMLDQNISKKPELKEAMSKGMKNGVTLTVFDNMVEDENFAAALPKIRAAGYRTALLTNNCFRNAEKKRSSILENAAKGFDVVVESCREGIRKPNPEIYFITAKKLDVKPEECIFIDDFEENCEGARSAGMTAVQVHGLDTLKAVKELEILLGMKLL